MKKTIPEDEKSARFSFRLSCVLTVCLLISCTLFGHAIYYAYSRGAYLEYFTMQSAIELLLLAFCVFVVAAFVFVLVAIGCDKLSSVQKENYKHRVEQMVGTISTMSKFDLTCFLLVEYNVALRQRMGDHSNPRGSLDWQEECNWRYCMEYAENKLKGYSREKLSLTTCLTPDNEVALRKLVAEYRLSISQFRNINIPIEGTSPRYEEERLQKCLEIGGFIAAPTPSPENPSGSTEVR